MNKDDLNEQYKEQYKICVVCGEINASYKNYCSRCNSSLKIKAVGAATSTVKII